MKLKLALLFMLVSVSAHAATYKNVEKLMNGWIFTYEGNVMNHYIPFKVFVFRCAAGDKCATTDKEARTVADGLAIKTETPMTKKMPKLSAVPD